MKNLTNFEKIALGLLVAFQGGVFILILLPEFFDLLSKTTFAGDFANSDLAMVALTAAIVFFAGLQVVLQWNQHQFDRNAQQASFQLALYEHRSAIYIRLTAALSAVHTNYGDHRPAMADFTKYYTQNRFFLPLLERDFVNLFLKNCIALDDAHGDIFNLANHTVNGEAQRPLLTEARKQATIQHDWFAAQYFNDTPSLVFARLLEFNSKL